MLYLDHMSTSNQLALATITGKTPGRKLTSPDQLNVGDILILNDLYYQIQRIDPLYFSFTIGTAPTSDVVVSTNLSNYELKFPASTLPNPNEIYYFNAIGIDGTITFQIEFPWGTPRFTPHGAPVFLTSVDASKEFPLPIAMFIDSNNPLALKINTPSNFVQATVWLFGKKLQVTVVQQGTITAPGTALNAIANGANWWKGFTTWTEKPSTGE